MNRFIYRKVQIRAKEDITKRKFGEFAKEDITKKRHR